MPPYLLRHPLRLLFPPPFSPVPQPLSPRSFSSLAPTFSNHPHTPPPASIPPRRTKGNPGRRRGAPRRRRNTRFPRGCRRPRTAASAPGCQGDGESGNLGKPPRSLPPPPTPQQTPLQFEPVSPPRPQCAVRQVRIPWPTGRGSGRGRRMRAVRGFSLPDSSATGKPWRCSDNPRAGAVSVRRPRGPARSSWQRVERAGSARNSGLTPPPAHCGEAGDSLWPARMREPGIPRGWDQKIEVCWKLSLLPPSLCLRNEGSPPSSCPEPFPYKSPAELATHSSGTLSTLLTHHYGSPSPWGKAPFIPPLASKAL